MALPSDTEYQDFLNRTADALYRALLPGDATGPEVLKFLRGAALGYCVDVLGQRAVLDLGAAFALVVTTKGTPTS